MIHNTDCKSNFDPAIPGLSSSTIYTIYTCFANIDLPYIYSSILCACIKCAHMHFEPALRNQLFKVHIVYHFPHFKTSKYKWYENELILFFWVLLFFARHVNTEQYYNAPLLQWQTQHFWTEYNISNIWAGFDAIS